MQDNQNQSSLPTIIIDTRLAQDPIRSGIGRFIVGFTKALAHELSRQPASQAKKWKILLVGKKHPPGWILELVKTHPTAALYWSGGPGALSKDLEKPVYAWSSLTLKSILKLTNQVDFFWLAPGNFDRPLTLFKPSKLRLYEHICQIIHDTIPYDIPESNGFLFRSQFKFFTKRSLNKLKHVYTVSEHTAHRLSQVAPKRTQPVVRLDCGIDTVFGAKKKIIDATELLQRRIQFLKNIGANTDSFVEKLANCKWVIGVGRPQAYKRWDLAVQAIESAKKQISQPILFVRVGVNSELSLNEIDNTGQPSSEFGGITFKPEIPMLTCAFLNDDALAALYRLGDLLLHPSLAEGFGLPPAEAALCGLPVLHATGTAVDDHFGGLPLSFWRGIGSTDYQLWGKAVAEMLFPKAEKFFDELANASTTRSYVMKFAKRSFNWQDTAQTFLNSLS